MNATDRVRRHTAAAVLDRIDRDTESRLLDGARRGTPALSEHIASLEREWDTDRLIEAEAAGTALTGLALAAFVHPRLILVPGVVAAAVFLHATTGWYPLLALLRRLGVRSPREIERERYALKALRGDFSDMEAPSPTRMDAVPAARVRVGATQASMDAQLADVTGSGRGA